MRYIVNIRVPREYQGFGVQDVMFRVYKGCGFRVTMGP